MSRKAKNTKKALQQYRDRIQEIEQNPYYKYRPDVKMMRIRACLLEIQELEGRIRRCEKSSPRAVQNTKRVKKMEALSSYTGMEHPYSSGRGAWSGGTGTSYTHTNISRPCSGGRCSPR